jgi:DNA helicase HerA-like ATPase
VLGATAAQGEGPFVAWVKEGRKYDLGAMLITQQPGSIPQEILSQGDNWFVFHLLSAHFSDDLLSSLLNEPIPGHGVFWSSAGETPYPIPIRANPPIPPNRRSTATCPGRPVAVARGGGRSVSR